MFNKKHTALALGAAVATHGLDRRHRVGDRTTRA